MKHMVKPAQTRLKSGLKLPSSVPDPVIEVNELTKDYVSGAGSVRALDHISIGIARRRFTAIMGPSGSGKSTFMHCLAGFESATSGSIKIDGTEIVGMNQRRLTRLRRDRIGFIFQAFNLIPTLSAKENILLPFEISRNKVPEDRFEQVVRALGLEDRLRHRPSELSGGQQQRVACARALMQDAVVLFADEPTGNLDSESSKQVLRYLREAVNDFGQSVVMVTHEAAAAAYADRVLFLSDGQIVAELNHPERESVLAAQSELPHFIQTHPLSRGSQNTDKPQNGELSSPDYLPAANKAGTWPDREKMQTRLANLQIARGAKIDTAPTAMPQTKAPAIDAGVLNALMGTAKPVVPAELLTKEGARRALAQSRQEKPQTTKTTPNTRKIPLKPAPAKTDTPGTNKLPKQRLNGSAWESRDERGTTWRGWTPKPGQNQLTSEKDSLPRPKQTKPPTTSKKQEKASGQPNRELPKKATPAKESRHLADNERWSGLYSVFSNPVNETSGFWEDAPSEIEPENPNRDLKTKAQATVSASNATNTINSAHSHSANTSNNAEESTGVKPRAASPIKPKSPVPTGTKSSSQAFVSNQVKPRESSAPIARTPEETLNQEKQRLFNMIKKAEALLESSQDAIDSLQDSQDKA